MKKERAGEIVGHIGIVKIEVREYRVAEKREEIYLIHAGGAKNKGGEVKKVRLYRLHEINAVYRREGEQIQLIPLAFLLSSVNCLFNSG